MNSPFQARNDAISTDEALKAARFALKIAEKDKVRSAICGGLAMHLYGFTRATKDVDFIADFEIQLPKDKNLSFGGFAYKVEIEGKEYEIDWILRNDDQKDLYVGALRDVIFTDDGLPIITPEWLVILKHIAGRGKDHMDCVWLLRKDNLVNRATVFHLIKAVMGKHAFWAIKDLESVMLEADLMKAKDELGDKNGS